MRKYDDDYKREAVRKLHDGQSVASLARDLGVAESLPHKWKRDAVEASANSEKEVIAPAQAIARGRDGARHIKKAALICGSSG